MDKSDFLNEIDILKKIFEGGSSPYVVTLVGCVTIQEPVCLVTALVTHGSLLDYLKYVRDKVNLILALQVTLLSVCPLCAYVYVCLCYIVLDKYILLNVVTEWTVLLYTNM